ncbi:hypothetical protein [Haladaptatus halobius]|uniref:hypothetical protein n=1 Tax=Haladaptatus halobius TaxID=2884875 RepID=UPI001D0BE05E|nr:hypothetical protein [Haladaptatus halobius]
MVLKLAIVAALLVALLYVYAIYIMPQLIQWARENREAKQALRERELERDERLVEVADQEYHDSRHSQY